MCKDNLTREILKIGNISLVEVYDKGAYGEILTKKYVVCSNYNPGKAYGNQWDEGIHYVVLSENDKEEKLKEAMKRML